MTDFQTFRDVEASLWQSAVAEALARMEPAAHQQAANAVLPSGSAHPDHPFARAAERAGTIIKHVKAVLATAGGIPAPVMDVLAVAGTTDPAALGVFAAVAAPRFATEADFLDAVRLKFGPLDPRWLEALRNYHRFLQNRRNEVRYVPYKNLGDFVIEGRLPPQARVALVADWGTGTDEAVALLPQIAAHDPDVLIHLGDIYYSGQTNEVERRFRQPVKQVFANKPTAIFTLAGNHDMYSGGAPYYRLLNDLGQPASYFCLRNTHWQFIAMDTGLNSDVGDHEPTSLKKEEVEWVRDKIATAQGRRTILLSHHQLFSAHERIGGGSINPRLTEQIVPLLPPDTMWYWGHEHDLVVYGAKGNVRGRCIGHGAIPVPFRLVPRARIDNNELPVDESIQLARNGLYYNHGYVLVELDGATGTETFYQYPAEEGPARQLAL
jgi:hypothetical protein